MRVPNGFLVDSEIKSVWWLLWLKIPLKSGCMSEFLIERQGGCYYIIAEILFLKKVVAAMAEILIELEGSVAIAEILFLKKVVAAMAEIPKSFKGTVVANEYG